MNSVNLMGRLTADPELKYASTGTAMVSGTIAVNRSFKTNDGVEADFIRFKAFKKTAELIAGINKGQQVGFSGRWQTGSFTNNQNEKIYTNECIVNEITFVSGQGNNSAPQTNQQSQPPQRTSYAPPATKSDPFSGNGNPVDISDDDLPF